MAMKAAPPTIMADSKKTEKKTVAQELKIERERSRLDVEQLTNYLDRGEAMTSRRREISE